MDDIGEGPLAAKRARMDKGENGTNGLESLEDALMDVDSGSHTLPAEPEAPVSSSLRYLSSNN